MSSVTPIEIVIDSLQKAGSRITLTSDGRYQAQCPGHEDHKASLSIREAADGKVLLKCHAGCTNEDILRKLGLTYRELFPDNESGVGTKPEIRKIYDYTDPKGSLLFQTVRYHPKDFRQRRPDGRGGWNYNLNRVERVPYNLPGVCKAVTESKPVFICEGEKDANSLLKRGLCGTTSPLGAGKWSESFNQWFEGTDIVILPDNDQPGRTHAKKVAESLLSKGNVKSVRIVELPGLKEKQDVTDWLLQGGSAEELLRLTFKTDILSGPEEVRNSVDSSESEPKKKELIYKDLYREEGHCLFSMINNEIVADFAIDIRSVVYDDREGLIYYIKIRQMLQGKLKVSDTIEIRPETLDDLRSFYRVIRPFTTGEIYQYKDVKTKPLRIFKWLLNRYTKPIVRRPDHIGMTRDTQDRPFWIFGNAIICPPWQDEQGKIVLPNRDEEFIVDDHTGFATPLFKNEDEKQKLFPIVDTRTEHAEQFLGEVKTRLIELIGGGDPTGNAGNYGKLLLAYVMYHLFEQELYQANDLNGHTVMFYVHGPKGTGKTTYFNTILRAFFGLQSTEQTKGNTVTTPALENKMGMLSSLPVCYDEYNPDLAKIDYQAINGYYHKTARQVSDIDRKGRNKYTPIRSTLSFTSNYPINLDINQADATESRMIYFQYKKEYRSNKAEVFDWFKENLDRLSKITVHLLLRQTYKDRQSIKNEAEATYQWMKDKLDRRIGENPNNYNVEHRLTDNYTRLLACYEHEFGRDEKFRGFLFQEILHRFSQNRLNDRDHYLINQIIYLANSGRLKNGWHYLYNDSQRELYINMGQCYEVYEEYKRERSLSKSQFRDILISYLDGCGGFQTGTKRWSGKFINDNHQQVTVYKAQHSHVLAYWQVGDPENQLDDLFPPPEEVRGFIKTAWEQHLEEKKPKSEQLNLDEEVPF